MNEKQFTVMMDDCVCAIAGAAMARISSEERNNENRSAINKFGRWLTSNF